MEPTPFDLIPDDAQITDSRHRPFYIAVPGATTAALLIHGFTGSPWEMREPAAKLAAAGISSLALRLPGHGTSPQDLARCRYEQWLDTVLTGRARLLRDYRNVAAVGLSTGAMLALAAQTTHPFARLALLAPYLAFHSKLAPLASLLRHIIPYQRRPVAPQLQGIYYEQRPLAGIHQLNRLRRHVRQLLPEITAPTLVVCAEGDQTVAPDSAVQLYRLLGSAKKQLHRFGRDVPHVLTTEENPHLEETLQLLVDFIGAEG